MKVIGHDDEVVEPEFPSRDVRTKQIDSQCGIPVRLQQYAPLAGLGSGEEGARGTQELFGAGITSGRAIRRAKARLKPNSFRSVRHG
jgi:hypothetical protein